ncbi:hypothetical protein HOD29_05800 [archaeon]|jgi:hypothetical protein|nr:hypothetical protein [archaeon]
MKKINYNQEVSKFLEIRKIFIREHDYSQHTIEHIKKSIGKGLATKLKEVFRKDELIIQWFYSPAMPFENKTPNEYWKIDKEQVKRVINSNYLGDLPGC